MNKRCKAAVEAWSSCRRREWVGTFSRLETVEEIVSAYCKNCQRGAKAEQEYYANISTFSEAIERAARAERPDGKRHDHQRRLSKSSLESARKELLKAPIRSCKTFADLHSLIEHTIRPISGIGELMVYDAALRIGARIGVEPEVVYLHAGARTGAKAMGLNTRRGCINLSELPDAMSKLKPREIEDCLCIFKDNLRYARA